MVEGPSRAHFKGPVWCVVRGCQCETECSGEHGAESLLLEDGSTSVAVVGK